VWLSKAKAEIYQSDDKDSAEEDDDDTDKTVTLDATLILEVRPHIPYPPLYTNYHFEDGDIPNFGMDMKDDAEETIDEESNVVLVVSTHIH
jgi:hypothetical protein